MTLLSTKPPPAGSQRFRPRPYQEVAVDSVIRRYRKGRRRLLLHLPTGAGKTVIAALLLERLQEQLAGAKTLFVAHRREILDQTVATLRRHMPELKVRVEQGARRVDALAGARGGASVDVVVASVQSLVKRKERFDPATFGLVICDECHRALAPSWTEVLLHFHDKQRTDALLLGMTATPRRTDGRTAIDVFEEVAYEISRTQLQDLGYMVPMRYFGVQADLGLDQVKLSAGDFQVRSLSAVMSTPALRRLTVMAWRERGMGKKTLAFCAGVRHARQLAADLTDALGVRAAVVDARTADREALVQRFREGGIDVLANYGVLTEGFDDPAIECILMARPTTSPLVYTQCTGRGLRPSPGKRACTVIDIVDRSCVQLQYGASQLAGLPRRWSSRGRDPFREQRSIGAIQVTDPEAFLRIREAASLEEVHGILMELPPDVVLAGLDGEPVPRYRPPAERPDAEAARREVAALLQQARLGVLEIAIDEEVVFIQLVDAANNNERADYLLWHLERVCGRDVVLREPDRPRTRSKKPRAALRSMLRQHVRVTDLDVDDRRNVARAAISDLDPGDEVWLRQAFLAQTGMALELTGQLALDLG